MAPFLLLTHKRKIVMNKLLNLKAGDVVQISPNSLNPAFAGCLMTVTEVKDWGVQGYVQALGTREGPGGQAYYRAKWDEVFDTGGTAEWVIGRASSEEEEEDKIPYLAVGNDELGGEVGETVVCKRCGEEHTVQYGDKVEPDGTKTPSKLLGFVN